MNSSGTTRLAVLLGDPVAHSRSPAMHNAAFAATSVDAHYLAWRIGATDLPGALQTLAAVGALGANVTVPHKELAAREAHTLDHVATLLECANTLCFKDGELRGLNTDAPGLERALREDLGGRTLRSLRKSDVVLLGAGGAARAALHALCALGFEQLHVANRDAKRRAAFAGFARTLKAPLVTHDWAELGSLADARLVINATSAQVKHEALAFPLPARAVIYDLSYGPTPLLKAAKRRGLVAHEGSGMLLHQAALAFSAWTNKRAPLDAMRKALRAQPKS